MSEFTGRNELHQVINDLFNNSLNQKLWLKISGTISRIPGLQSIFVPFWLSSLLMIILCVLVSLLVAWILGAITAFSLEYRYISLAAFWLWTSLLLSDWQIKKNLKVIGSQLSVMFKPSHEKEFIKWVKFFVNRRREAISATLFFLIIEIGWIIGMDLDFSNPVSWAFSTLASMGYAVSVLHSTWVLYIVLFYGYYVKQLELSLFQDNPSGTASLQILHRNSGELLLVLAIIVTLGIPAGIFSNMFRVSLVIMSAVGIGLPLLIFYIATENAFSNHIRKAKYGRMTQLQKQISNLEMKKDAASVDKVKLIRELLDFHEQIKRTPNSLVNLDSLLNLFGSLALPFLGALLNILDIWKNLFGKR
jgi:hypothetical protein